jgi:hypothetical protein
MYDIQAYPVARGRIHKCLGSFFQLKEWQYIEPATSIIEMQLKGQMQRLPHIMPAAEKRVIRRIVMQGQPRPKKKKS